MKLLSERSETNASASLTGPDTGTGLTLEQMRRVSPIRVGMQRLERLCRPQAETFWVLGGRPGAYKTALLWNLALNAARLGQRILFASLEMTPAEMSLLALARFSGLDRQRIEMAFMPDGVPFRDHEQAQWDRAVLEYQGLELRVRIHGADEHGRSLDDVLRSACRHAFDAVFVDHLGMIGRDGAGKELDVLSQAIHRLRGLSRGEVRQGYRPWVIATSQLNREIDKGDENRIPRLADFRGSARIEHDSDVAIALQKRKPVEGSPVGYLDGFVLKNRKGPAPEILLFEANGATGLVAERSFDRVTP